MRLDVMQRVKHYHSGSYWDCVLLCRTGFLIAAENF
jgi:hypothetical protein